MKHVSMRPKQQISLDEIVKDYLIYLETVRELETNSLTHYGNDLSLFVRFVERMESVQAGQMSAARLTPKHVKAFLDEQTIRRGNGSSSNRRRLSCLRGFFRYLADQEVLPSDALSETPMPALPKRRPVILSPDEVKGFLAAVRLSAPFPIRDEAIFRTFLSCGCRLSELLRLRSHDVDLTDGRIRFSRKPGQSRVVSLPDPAGKALARYITKRPNSPVPSLFLNRHRNPITKGAVYHAFRRCLGIAGIRRPGVTVHSLRNTFLAGMAQDSEISLKHIRDIAGVKTENTLAPLFEEARMVTNLDRFPDTE